MATIYFIFFIVVCALVVFWAMRKSQAETDLVRQRKTAQLKKSGVEKLETPRDNLLSHNNELWQSRRNRATTGVSRTNQFIPKSVSKGEPEYDGYSRRDRHHVRERTAQVKQEGHIEDKHVTPGVKIDPKEHATQA